MDKGMRGIAESGLRLWKAIRQTLRLMVGVPDYGEYVKHRQTSHPDLPVLSYEEFFRECQLRRYEGAGSGRCC